MARLLFAAVVFSAIVASLADEDYNFNSYKYCKKSGQFTKSLSSGQRATVLFREKTQIDPLQLVPDECSMQFSTSSITKRRLRVKFDSLNRYINDSLATLTFYDDKEVKLSKKLAEFSKKKPIKPTSVVKTTGRYLTIKVSRDVKKSKKFNVEMVVEPVSAGAVNAVWSSTLMSLSALYALIFALK